ncbi:MAG: reverse transcriptase family protein [Patescibacteria group bacterium]|nr:reverse transcriptase family protein [Patescibacteria group bacterium]MBU1877286.1 reverse transcriptase family protein [Patescibacteria group bacterium]
MRQTRIDEWFSETKQKKKLIAKIQKVSALTKTRPESFWEKLEKALPLRKDYREAKIPKRSGGYRTIYMPSPELKKVQKNILRYLQEIWQVHYGPVHGLSPGGSCVKHARIHSASRWIFQFDIKNAFPSTNIITLRKLLSQIIPVEVNLGENATKIAYTRAELIIKLTTFQEGLPQGAPTSPFLFYIVLTSRKIIPATTGGEIRLTGLFYKLWSACPRGYKISCYVDGFVISGPKPISPKTQEKIFKTIRKESFEINQKKTRIQDCRHGTVMICGLAVDGKGRISLPKKTIRKWRGIIGKARFDPENLELRQKIEGFVASLKPIYEKGTPPQITKPYNRYQRELVKTTS